MLIPIHILKHKFNLNITGVLHIGAHECEEMGDYIRIGISHKNVYWVEAMKNKVYEMKRKDPTLNIYHVVASDKDDEEVTLNVTNNGQSSSIFEFGTHEKHHPYVNIVRKENYKTTRLDTLIKNENIPIEKLNFLNMDIQGSELKAVKGLGDHLKTFDYLYSEVNREHLYKDCCLIDELEEYIGQYGFKRVAINMTEWNWGDAFYMKV